MAAEKIHQLKSLLIEYNDKKALSEIERKILQSKIKFYNTLSISEGCNKYDNTTDYDIPFKKY